MSGDMTAGRGGGLRSITGSIGHDRPSRRLEEGGDRCRRGGMDDSGRTGLVVGHRARPDGHRVLAGRHHHVASDRGDLRLRCPVSRTACCSDNTYLVDEPDLELRPDVSWPCRAGGPRSSSQGSRKPDDCEDVLVYVFVCTGDTAAFPARFPVRCADGEIYLFDGTVTAVCLDCDLELDARRGPRVWRSATRPRRRRRPKQRRRRRAPESTTTTTEAAGAAHQRGVEHHDDRSGRRRPRARSRRTTTTEPQTAAPPSP